MAVKATIGANVGDLLVGEDKVLSFHVLDDVGVPVNIAGWAMLFVVRRPIDAGTTAISVAATITGTYDIDPDVNTQRAVVTLTDDHLAASAFAPSGSALKHVYSLKRTDAGFETVLAYGDFAPELASQT